MGPDLLDRQLLDRFDRRRDLSLTARPLQTDLEVVEGRIQSGGFGFARYRSGIVSATTTYRFVKR